MAEHEGRAPIANADSIGAVGNDPISNVPIIAPFITSEPNMLISRPERRCAPHPSTSHLEPGRTLLRDMLGGGEPVPQKSREMGADDISKRTLDRAKKKLGVESEGSDTSKGRHPIAFLGHAHTQ